MESVLRGREGGVGVPRLGVKVRSIHQIPVKYDGASAAVGRAAESAAHFIKYPSNRFKPSRVRIS